MSQINNSIILVEDDKDDQELFVHACEELGIKNEIIIFSSPQELIDYLATDIQVPFFILCDYNLPQKNGFQLWNEIKSDEDTKYKGIPFLLWSTAASEQQLRKAYDGLIQGFFIKPTEFDELLATLKAIITYWSYSRHPKRLE